MARICYTIICHLRKHSFEQTRATWSRSTVTFARWKRQKLLAKWEERQLVCQIQLSSQIFPRDDDFKGVLFDMDTTRSVAQYLVLIQHSLLWSHAIWQKYVLFLYVYILLELYLQNSHFTLSPSDRRGHVSVCVSVSFHFEMVYTSPLCALRLKNKICTFFIFGKFFIFNCWKNEWKLIIKTNYHE